MTVQKDAQTAVGAGAPPDTRAIGKALGVADTTAMRDMERAGAALAAPEPEHVTGTDGKQYPAKRPERCHWCDGPRPAKAKTGRPRLYCSIGCKNRAYRARREQRAAMALIPAEHEPGRPADSDALHAVMLAWAAASALLKAAPDLPAETGEQFRRVGSALVRALRRADL